MFFNKRKRFNAEVSALLPGFGFNLQQAGVFKVLNVLDAAWSNGFNKYEAGLMAAYLYVAGLYEHAQDEEAENTIKRIDLIQADWLQKGIVGSDNVSEFRKNAEGIWAKVKRAR